MFILSFIRKTNKKYSSFPNPSSRRKSIKIQLMWTEHDTISTPLYSISMSITFQTKFWNLIFTLMYLVYKGYRANNFKRWIFHTKILDIWWLINLLMNYSFLKRPSVIGSKKLIESRLYSACSNNYLTQQKNDSKISKMNHPVYVHSRILPFNHKMFLQNGLV